MCSALLDRGHRVLAVVGTGMTESLRRLEPRVEVATGRLDRGYARLAATSARPPGVDAAATRSMLHAAAVPDPTVTERLLAWDPDVVAADATPWASLVAEGCGVPSVLCSSFSWDDQYAAIFAGHPEAAPAVDAVRRAVRRFQLGLVFPLGSGLPSVGERLTVPLVARRPSGGSPHPWLAARDRNLVVSTFGETAVEARPTALLAVLADRCREAGLTLAIDAAAARGAGDGPWEVPPDDLPWPDLLAAARLVVTKAGYSTVAETLRGRGYVLAIGVTGIPEEHALLAEVERGGYGRAIPHGEPDIASLAWQQCAELLARPPRQPNEEDGAQAVADALEAIVGGPAAAS